MIYNRIFTLHLGILVPILKCISVVYLILGYFDTLGTIDGCIFIHFFSYFALCRGGCSGEKMRTGSEPGTAETYMVFLWFDS